MTSDDYEALLAALPDCDGNALPDSADIADGTADDLNHNGWIDECDADTTLDVIRRPEAWKSWQQAADTSFFSTRHQANQTIEVRYTVPHSGAEVRLTVLSPNGGTLRRLVGSRQASGAYMLSWDKRDDHDRTVPPGRYVVRLTVGGRRYERPIRWGQFR
jgi:hypothetical protein